MLHHAQNSFSAGALSPYVSARPQLEVYSQGATRLNNWISLPYGGIRFRPGSEFIADTKANGQAELYGFEFATGDRHIIEFGENYLRFYTTGTDTKDQIEVDSPAAWVTLTAYSIDDYVTESSIEYRCLEAHTSGTFATDLAANKWEALSIYEVTSPYSVADLKQLQFAQLNDIVIITHPDYAPRRLSRFGLRDWVLEEYPFLNPPFLDAETDATKAITASATTGTGITLTTQSDVFDDDHVGAVFELAYRRNQDEIQQTLDVPSGAGSSSVTVKDGRLGTTTTRNNLEIGTPIRCDGAFTIQTFGTWTANIEVFRRYLGETNWEEYLVFEGANDRNVNEAYTVDAPAELMLVVADTPAPTSTNGRIVLSVTDPYIRGRVTVTAVANAQSATADVDIQLVSGASTEWSEAAFSDFRGYPRAVTFHAQRLWFGGTVSRPQTMFGSRIDGYDDFARPFATDETTDADAALALPVFSEQQNTIEWMSSNRSLLVGTSAGEFVVTGETREESISVGDYNIRRHTSKGSAALQALPIDGQVVFVQRQGRRLRRMGYEFDKDAYRSDDLTIYNEHLTRTGIVSLAFQRQREEIIWGVTGDGRLIGWTYREDQPFLAGFEVTMSGQIESVAVVYGDDDEDEVWLVVNRGGGRYVERLRPDQVLAQEEGNLSDLWFVDAAVEYNAPTVTCTGLDHLEGEEVMVICDGVYKGVRTVASGSVTNYDATATRTLVGEFYENEWETMNIETGMENGTSVGRMKSCGHVVMRFFKSLGGKFNTSQNAADLVIKDLSPQQSLVTPRPLQNLDVVQPCMAGETRTLRFGGCQTVPYPMTILSTGGRINITEDS